MKRETVLIGRDEELAVLRDLIDGAVASGEGGCLAIIGEAGVGKSTLLAVAERDARSEPPGTKRLMMLTSAGVPSEAQLPYAALHSMLQPLADRIADIPAAQRDALLTAFGQGATAEPEPFLIALAVLSLLTDEAARRPVVVIVDDIHWLDQPSQDVISFLARRVAGDRIVIVVAARPGESRFDDVVGFDVLRIDALNDEDAAALLSRSNVDLSPSDRQRILREAAGNPLALVELPIAWSDAPGSAIPTVVPLTDRLERSFVRRMGELPDLTRAALLVAAIDYESRVAEILRATEVLTGRTAGVDVFEPAERAGLVRYETTRIAFRHPLVRSGVVQAERPARLQAAHAAIAHVLADEPYRQAWHRAHSIVGPDDAVADALERTHLESLRRGSASAAIAALERSAELTRDPRVRGRRLLLAAEHAFGLGRADIVDRLISAAAALPLGDLDRARMEWLREIFNDGVPGDAVRVFELCDIATHAVLDGDRDLALNLLLGAALRCWWADPGEKARRRVVDGVLSVPDSALDPRHVAILAVADPIGSAAEAKRLYDSVPLETASDANALRLWGMAAHAIGDPPAAIDFLSRAELRLREQGRLAMLSHSVTMQIINHIELGSWDRAVSAGEEGLRLAQESGQPVWDVGTHTLTAIVDGIRGNRTRAETVAAEAEVAAGGQRLGDLLACVQLARGFAALTGGEPSTAMDELLRLFDPRDLAYHVTEKFHGIAYLVEAAVRSSRTTELVGVLECLSLEAQATPSTTLRAHLAYARAVLADDSTAESLYVAALADDLMRWPLARARLELAYGSWLRRQRRVAESRGPLRSAAATFAAIGADWWSDEARGELRAAGERLPDDVNNVDLLSAQELQIARLAAEGLSNREIGARLFLSPRTVGSHLYKIFPKLGITSRGQLAHRLR